MKINTRGKCMTGVMANSGFGMLFIKRTSESGEVAKIMVPESWIFDDGRIKKYAQKTIDKMFAKAFALNSLCEVAVEKEDTYV